MDENNVIAPDPNWIRNYSATLGIRIRIPNTDLEIDSTD